ncbi:hypothetical protein ACHAP3_008849 [Botrytis cinerea]
MSNENSTAAVFISNTGARILASFAVIISTVFVASRFYIRYTHKRLWYIEDNLSLAAWSFNFAACMGYLAILEPFGRLIAVSRGEIPVYATVADDAVYVPRVLFPTNLLFWTTLWTVKLLLLMQVKRLLDRQKRHTRIWWCISAFTLVVYIGCVISQFLACRSLAAWFEVGACGTPHDVYASFVSTVWAFCADITTDIIIAVFPMPILWRLQMSQKQKLGIIGVFSVGFMSAIASIVRFTAVMITNGTSQPSVVWQAAWGMVEMAVAVVASSLPTFGILIASRSSAARSYELTNLPTEARTNTTDPYAQNPTTRIRQTILDNDSEEALNPKDSLSTSTIQAHAGRFYNRSSRNSRNEVEGIVVSREIHAQHSGD